jgi:hypothetical protein
MDMNYPRLLQEITGKPYSELPPRWEHRLDRFIEKAIPGREFKILERWTEGETMVSIAEYYAISDARVSQLRHRAVKRLRRKLLQNGWLKFSKAEIDHYWPASAWSPDRNRDRTLAEQRLTQATRRPVKFKTVTLGRGENWSVGFTTITWE